MSQSQTSPHRLMSQYKSGQWLNLRQPMASRHGFRPVLRRRRPRSFVGNWRTMRSGRPSLAIPRSVDNALQGRPRDVKVSVLTIAIGAPAAGRGQIFPGTKRTTAVNGARPS